MLAAVEFDADAAIPHIEGGVVAVSDTAVVTWEAGLRQSVAACMWGGHADQQKVAVKSTMFGVSTDDGDAKAVFVSVDAVTADKPTSGRLIKVNAGNNLTFQMSWMARDIISCDDLMWHTEVPATLSTPAGVIFFQIVAQHTGVQMVRTRDLWPNIADAAPHLMRLYQVVSTYTIMEAVFEHDTDQKPKTENRKNGHHKSEIQNRKLQIKNQKSEIESRQSKINRHFVTPTRTP